MVNAEHDDASCVLTAPSKAACLHYLSTVIELSFPDIL